MRCGLCGLSHSSEVHVTFLEKDNCDEKLSLAFKSLPSWIALKNGIVMTKQKLKKYTSLGRLIAPYSVQPTDDTFPLKVSINANSVIFIDLSNKNLSNWLSLIPPDKENCNVWVVQAGLNISFISNQDIKSGESLKVWYAPFYDLNIANKHDDISIIRPLEYSLAKTNQVNDTQTPSTVNQHIKYSSDKKCENANQYCNNSYISKFNDNTNSDIFSLDSEFIDSELDNSSHTDNLFSSSAGCKLVVRNVQCNTEKVESNHEGNCNTNSSQKISVKNNTNDHCNVKSANKIKPKVIYVYTGANNTSGTSPQVADVSVNNLNAERNPHKVIVKVLHNSVDERKKIYNEQQKTSDVKNGKSNKSNGKRNKNSDYRCLHCSKLFSQTQEYALHIKKHLLWNLGRQNLCRICNKYFGDTAFSRHRHDAKKLNPFQYDNLNYRSYAEKMEVSQNVLSPLSSLPVEVWVGPYCCAICPKRFTKAEYLLRHLKKHLLEFVCKRCSKSFARKESLLKHSCNTLQRNTQQQQQHQEQNHQLPTSLSQLHSSGASINKDVCNTSLASTLNVFTFECKKCSESFSSASKLKQHAMAHIEDNSVSCNACGNTFANQHIFTQHNQMCQQFVSLALNGRAECTQCYKSFSDATEMKQHFESHTKQFRCKPCKEMFTSKAGYESHSCSTPHKCDHCECLFSTLQSLQRHISLHGPPLFTCKKCVYPFYTKKSLLSHTCNIEFLGGPKPSTAKPSLSCPDCNAKFSTKYNLNRHLASIHGTEHSRPFQCDLCPKRFHRRDLLSAHTLTHTHAHVPGNHVCRICFKTFKRISSLRIHSLLHKKGHRFKCALCDKGYTQKVNLRQHLKAQHYGRQHQQRKQQQLQQQQQIAFIPIQSDNNPSQPCHVFIESQYLNNRTQPPPKFYIHKDNHKYNTP